MKEIIAYRFKNYFILIFTVSFVTMSLSAAYSFFVLELRTFYIVSACVWGLLALLGLIGLCFPKWVIAQKETASLLIHNGFHSFKTVTIPLSDIVDVKAVETPLKNKPSKFGTVVLTVKTVNGPTKDMKLFYVKNASAVAEKIKSLISAAE